MIGEPMTEEELDSIELCANIVIEAIASQDYDTAFITASMSEHPVMLAMFIAEMFAVDE